jgi:hypothetical protein
VVVDEVGLHPPVGDQRTAHQLRGGGALRRSMAAPGQLLRPPPVVGLHQHDLLVVAQSMLYGRAAAGQLGVGQPDGEAVAATLVQSHERGSILRVRVHRHGSDLHLRG